MTIDYSDSQNVTSLVYDPSMNDGGRNESSGMHSNFTRYVDPQWNERRQTNSGIFLVMAALCLIFIFVKIFFCSKHSQRLSGMRVASVHGDPTKEIKTEEYITNRLVLKHVVKCSPDKPLQDEEMAMPLDWPTQCSNFHKSDLAIPDSGDNDEVDQENDSAVVCAICLCEYEVGDQICWSNNQNCRHHFHSACGIAWLAKHSECPVCRSPYLVEPEMTMPTKTTEVEVEMGDANQPDRPSTLDTGGQESGASQDSIDRPR